MLSAQYLYTCTDEISSIYAELETEIINDIARRIAKTGRVTSSAEWQILKAQESGSLYRSIIKKVAKASKISDKEVKRLFEEAGIKSVSYDNKIYNSAGLEPMTLKQSPAMLQTLVAGMIKTSGTLRNITMTTAMTAQMDFINATDKAYFEITSGAFDYNTAIKRAVIGCADKGVSVVDYATGRRDHIDVAVRRSVLTGVNQTCAKITETQALEMNCKLVEVSSHIGSRPEHQLFQGKIFSMV